MIITNKMYCYLSKLGSTLTDYHNKALNQSEITNIC